jgi:fibronectin type 3 domain-containing protein
MMRKLFLLAALACLCVAAACSGNSAGLTPQANPELAPAPAETGGLPAFPQETGLRSTSADGGSLTLLGSQFIQDKWATVDGDSLVVGPAEGDGKENTAYGLYKFEGLGGKHLLALTVNALPGDIEMKYFVALADFTNLKWKWFGPVDLPEFQYNFENDANHYISPLGNVYFIVATHGSNVTTHSSSTLTFGDAPPPGGGGDPGAPTDLVASDGTFSDHVQLAWKAGDGAEWYEIYRHRVGDDPGVPEWGKIGESQMPEFADTDVVAGRVYYYKVRSAAGGNNNEPHYSGFSNVDSGYVGQGNGGHGPGTPSDLAASDGTYTNQVRVTWKGGDNTQWFELYRNAGDPNTEWVLIATTNSPVFEDTGVTPGHVYYYKVRGGSQGDNGNQYSDFSNTDSGYAGTNNGGDGPGKPNDLRATDGSYAEIVRVTWKGGANTEWYEVYRNDSNQSGWQLLGTVTGLVYEDASVTPGAVYYYKVRGGNQGEGGNRYSDPSNEDDGWAGTHGDLPGEPYNLQATDGKFEHQVSLSWHAGQGQTDSYEIWRYFAGQQDGWKQIGTSQAAAFEDTDVTPGAVYYYKVRAVRNGNNNNFYSDYSNVDSGYAGDPNTP